MAAAAPAAPEDTDSATHASESTDDAPHVTAATRGVPLHIKKMSSGGVKAQDTPRSNPVRSSTPTIVPKRNELPKEAEKDAGHKEPAASKEKVLAEKEKEVSITVARTYPSPRQPSSSPVCPNVARDSAALAAVAASPAANISSPRYHQNRYEKPHNPSEKKTEEKRATVANRDSNTHSQPPTPLQKKDPKEDSVSFKRQSSFSSAVPIPSFERVKDKALSRDDAQGTDSVKSTHSSTDGGDGILEEVCILSPAAAAPAAAVSLAIDVADASPPPKSPLSANESELGSPVIEVEATEDIPDPVSIVLKLTAMEDRTVTVSGSLTVGGLRAKLLLELSLADDFEMYHRKKPMYTEEFKTQSLTDVGISTGSHIRVIEPLPEAGTFERFEDVIGDDGRWTNRKNSTSCMGDDEADLADVADERHGGSTSVPHTPKAASTPGHSCSPQTPRRNMLSTPRQRASTMVRSHSAFDGVIPKGYDSSLASALPPKAPSSPTSSTAAASAQPQPAVKKGSPYKKGLLAGGRKVRDAMKELALKVDDSSPKEVAKEQHTTRPRSQTGAARELPVPFQHMAAETAKAAKEAGAASPFPKSMFGVDVRDVLVEMTRDQEGGGSPPPSGGISPRRRVLTAGLSETLQAPSKPSPKKKSSLMKEIERNERWLAKHDGDADAASAAAEDDAPRRKGSTRSRARSPRGSSDASAAADNLSVADEELSPTRKLSSSRRRKQKARSSSLSPGRGDDDDSQSSFPSPQRKVSKRKAKRESPQPFQHMLDTKARQDAEVAAAAAAASDDRSPKRKGSFRSGDRDLFTPPSMEEESPAPRRKASVRKEQPFPHMMLDGSISLPVPTNTQMRASPVTQPSKPSPSKKRTGSFNGGMLESGRSIRDMMAGLTDGLEDSVRSDATHSTVMSREPSVMLQRQASGRSGSLVRGASYRKAEEQEAPHKKSSLLKEIERNEAVKRRERREAPASTSSSRRSGEHDEPSPKKKSSPHRKSSLRKEIERNERWFKTHPEEDEDGHLRASPMKKGSASPRKASPAKKTSLRKEIERNERWFKTHPDEAPEDESPPREHRLSDAALSTPPRTPNDGSLRMTEVAPTEAVPDPLSLILKIAGTEDKLLTVRASATVAELRRAVSGSVHLASFDMFYRKQLLGDPEKGAVLVDDLGMQTGSSLRVIEPLPEPGTFERFRSLLGSGEHDAPRRMQRASSVMLRAKEQEKTHVNRVRSQSMGHGRPQEHLDATAKVRSKTTTPKHAPLPRTPSVSTVDGGDRGSLPSTPGRSLPPTDLALAPMPSITSVVELDATEDVPDPLSLVMRLPGAEDRVVTVRLSSTVRDLRRAVAAACGLPDFHIFYRKKPLDDLVADCELADFHMQTGAHIRIVEPLPQPGSFERFSDILAAPRSGSGGDEQPDLQRCSSARTVAEAERGAAGTAGKRSRSESLRGDPRRPPGTPQQSPARPPPLEKVSPRKVRGHGSHEARNIKEAAPTQELPDPVSVVVKVPDEPSRVLTVRRSHTVGQLRALLTELLGSAEPLDLFVGRMHLLPHVDGKTLAAAGVVTGSVVRMVPSDALEASGASNSLCLTTSPMTMLSPSSTADGAAFELSVAKTNSVVLADGGADSVADSGSVIDRHDDNSEEESSSMDDDDIVDGDVNRSGHDELDGTHMFAQTIPCMKFLASFNSVGGVSLDQTESITSVASTPPQPSLKLKREVPADPQHKKSCSFSDDVDVCLYSMSPPEDDAARRAAAAPPQQPVASSASASSSSASATGSSSSSSGSDAASPDDLPHPSASPIRSASASGPDTEPQVGGVRQRAAASRGPRPIVPPGLDDSAGSPIMDPVTPSPRFPRGGPNAAGVRLPVVLRGLCLLQRQAEAQLRSACLRRLQRHAVLARREAERDQIAELRNALAAARTKQQRTPLPSISSVSPSQSPPRATRPNGNGAEQERECPPTPGSLSPLYDDDTDLYDLSLTRKTMSKLYSPIHPEVSAPSPHLRGAGGGSRFGLPPAPRDFSGYDSASVASQDGAVGASALVERDVRSSQSEAKIIETCTNRQAVSRYFRTWRLFSVNARFHRETFRRAKAFARANVKATVLESCNRRLLLSHHYMSLRMHATMGKVWRSAGLTGSPMAHVSAPSSPALTAAVAAAAAAEAKPAASSSGSPSAALASASAKARKGSGSAPSPDRQVFEHPHPSNVEHSLECSPDVAPMRGGSARRGAQMRKRAAAATPKSGRQSPTNRGRHSPKVRVKSPDSMTLSLDGSASSLTDMLLSIKKEDTAGDADKA